MRFSFTLWPNYHNWYVSISFEHANSSCSIFLSYFMFILKIEAIKHKIQLKSPYKDQLVGEGWLFKRKLTFFRYMFLDYFVFFVSQSILKIPPPTSLNFLNQPLMIVFKEINNRSPITYTLLNKAMNRIWM